jgi:hypothetical protein
LYVAESKEVNQEDYTRAYSYILSMRGLTFFICWNIEKAQIYHTLYQINIILCLKTVDVVTMHAFIFKAM